MSSAKRAAIAFLITVACLSAGCAISFVVGYGAYLVIMWTDLGHKSVAAAVGVICGAITIGSLFSAALAYDAS